MRFLIESIGCLAGILAIVVCASLLGLLIERGRLSFLGWSILLLAASLVIVLAYRLLRSIDPDYKEYLELINRTDFVQSSSPEEVKATVAKYVGRLETIFDHSESPLAASTESLSDLDHVLRNAGSSLPGQPQLLASIAAAYGRLLEKTSEGEWRLKAIRGYRDLVVICGRGLAKHEVSPGFVVFKAWKYPETSLQEYLKNEVEELSVDTS